VDDLDAGHSGHAETGAKVGGQLVRRERDDTWAPTDALFEGGLDVPSGG
jgi:hypothetical protein